MKKIILLFSLLFFIGLISSLQCSDPVSYSESGLTAVSKVCFGNPYPTSDGVFIDVDLTGLQLYYFEKLSSWSQVICNAGGCNGELILPGSVRVAEKGVSYSGCPTFVAFDRQDNKLIQAYAWSWSGLGYVGYSSCFSPVVSYECENGYTKCNSNNLTRCVDHNWANGGIVKGSCGVQCFPGDRYCENYLLRAPKFWEIIYYWFVDLFKGLGTGSLSSVHPTTSGGVK